MHLKHEDLARLPGMIPKAAVSKTLGVQSKGFGIDASILRLESFSGRAIVIYGPAPLLPEGDGEWGKRIPQKGRDGTTF